MSELVEGARLEIV